MVQSMTGYGTAAAEREGEKVTLETRSVNHRFIEVSIKGQNRSVALEDNIRKRVKGKFRRGSFDVFISIDSSKTEGQLELNKPMVEGYIKAAWELSERYGIAFPPGFGDFANIKEIFTISTDTVDLEELTPTIVEALDTALSALEKMRLEEGERIAVDFQERIEKIRQWVSQVKELNEKAAGERYVSLKEKVMKLASDVAVDEGRLAQEAALLAERNDITEEITRLESHLVLAGEILKEPEAIGRKMEFLLQEINRETNTIGSKSFSIEVTNVVLLIKGELEKLREQVQNLE